MSLCNRFWNLKVHFIVHISKKPEQRAPVILLSLLISRLLISHYSKRRKSSRTSTERAQDNDERSPKAAQLYYARSAFIRKRSKSRASSIWIKIYIHGNLDISAADLLSCVCYFAELFLLAFKMLHSVPRTASLNCNLI